MVSLRGGKGLARMEDESDSHAEREQPLDLGLEQAEYGRIVTSAEVLAHDGDWARRREGGWPDGGRMETWSKSRSVVGWSWVGSGCWLGT